MDAAEKILLIVLDGASDRPTHEGKTPFMSATTTYLDELAKEGILGIMDVIAPGRPPGSDTAHLSLLGYNPREIYTGRGPFEAAGVGIDVKPGDIAFRGNFATVRDGNVVDRRAGRIRDTHELAQAIQEKLDLDAEFIFKESAGHRAALVLRGESLSPHVTPSDPLHVGKMKVVRPTTDDAASQRTARILNEFTRQVFEILKNHPVNVEREKQGLLPGNTVLLRGAGVVPHLQSFEDRWGLKAAVIAATALVIGIGKLTGMDFILTDGATGGVDTNLTGKIKNVNRALKDHYFVLLNIKGADESGHDGDFEKKAAFLSRVDKELSNLEIDESILISITADHTTPVSLREHTGDPVPFLIRGKGVRTDHLHKFDEMTAAQGGMNRIRGLDIMPSLVDLIGKGKKFGA
jgi:2,3-bisphosphoglycerate-independent phosphoglycerate mutase